ncbi:sensor histidine kinase [Burkholderiaceae bacterium UC74_6]
MLSFRRRFVLAQFAVTAVALSLAAILGYLVLASSVRSQLDAAVLALAETEAGILAESRGQSIAIHEGAQGHAPFSFIRLDRLVQIIDADGNVLARSANLGTAKLPASAEVLRELALGETVFETVYGFGDEPVRVVSVPVRVGDALRGVQVAGSLDDVNHVVEAAGLLFLGLGACLVVALGTTSALLTRRMVSAIDDIVQRARRIGQANLSERLPRSESRDEIGRLVETLNEMLARIEHAFEAQRRFTADASHELRSPLSRLRAELEISLRRTRSAEEYRLALTSCQEEVERLTLLVDELLVLARLDAGQERSPADVVRLDLLAADAVRRMEPAALEKKIKLVQESSTRIDAMVGAGPINLVLGNLLDNAVKYSPVGSTVSIRVGEDSAAAFVAIADDGPGLSQADLPHVFDRFFRGEVARSADVAGLGLGLALSQAMIQAHGGHIEVASRAGHGAEFILRVPLSGAGGS